MPTTTSISNHLRRLGWMAVIMAVGAGVLLYWYWTPIWARLGLWFEFLSDREKIRSWVLGFGPAAPAVFIAIQALQVIFAPVPGEATGFLGGFLFGAIPGFVYSTIGLTLGSAAAFLLGRWLEINFVEKVVQREALDKFAFIVERQGTLLAFLLFLLPGFPKDYLCFILGLSKMPLKVFLLIVAVGRLPGTLMLSLQGAKVFEGEYLTVAVLLGLFLVVALLLLVYREKFYAWLQRLS